MDAREALESIAAGVEPSRVGLSPRVLRRMSDDDPHTPYLLIYGTLARIGTHGTFD